MSTPLELIIAKLEAEDRVKTVEAENKEIKDRVQFLEADILHLENR